MNLVKWLIGGFVGAAIGGAIWIAVGYFLEAEVGYIAWAIGLLAGIGVRVVADSDVGIGPGSVAVVCAVLAIVASKYLVVSMLVDSAFATEIPLSETQLTDESMIARIADEIVNEQTAGGATIAWPPGITFDDAVEQEHYPPPIWAEAQQRYEAIPVEERAENKRVAQQQLAEFSELIQDNLGGAMKQEAFRESFELFDLLWFGLAAFTAFRVGSGLATD